jgi:hypothetical protein
VSPFNICLRTDNSRVFLDEPGPASIDLSKATKLRDAAFHLNWWSVQWIITALQTITPKHRDLQQVTVVMSHYLTRLNVGVDVGRAVGETNIGQWLDLDRLLVRLWESRSIHPKVMCTAEQHMRGFVGCLLPEGIKRGIVDLAEP